MSNWTVERARLASLTRSRASDDPELLNARRNMRAARLEDYISKTLDDSPPFTDEQLDRLALLLRASTPNGGAAA